MFSDCNFSGPLFTPGFVTHALPALLSKRDLYPTERSDYWQRMQAGLREFAANGGPARVLHHVINPLATGLGYSEVRREEAIVTRDGAEDGGYLLTSVGGSLLRAWPVGSDIELESPSKRGTARRISPLRRSGRVLRMRGESIGLLTNGSTLALIFCDPAGPDSHVVISLAGRAGWAVRMGEPESSRLICALASPAGVAGSREIFDAARLHQTAVTKTLRIQARGAIEGFLQCVLDQRPNSAATPDLKVLWRETLTIVYRLLFILKLETSAEPGGGFSFAASETWRRCLSPNRALGPLVRRQLDLGHDTGRLLEDGLRVLFEICRAGLVHSTISIAPLGGGLFDPAATETLDALKWGERAVALMLDRLLWTVPRERERERVHYGSLDVEELGRVYESLLDLEPDIAISPMVRIRRGRLDFVMPAATVPDTVVGSSRRIPVGRFYLRSGFERRSGGSYYTPHEFVRYLVAETLTPLIAHPIEIADPNGILRIKVFDPAMGSGHFLVEACRFLADALYEACCRRELNAGGETSHGIDCLPDPDHRLSSYLPIRSRDHSEAGLSRTRAMAICRRLVTVHCLYGVDRDPLAVELAKLSLWLESFAEGLPLTFLDHRLVAGDSIAGPFFADLSTLPVGGGALDPLLAQGVTNRLSQMMSQAMAEVATLEASIGTNIADVMVKQTAKDRLDQLLLPLQALARAWSGGIMAAAREANDAWLALARSVADSGVLPAAPHQHQIALLDRGAAALPLDLTFPEIFRPDIGTGGFHAVLGNPPWDVVHYQTREFLAGFDPRIMDAATKLERQEIERTLLDDPTIKANFSRYKNGFIERKRLSDRLYSKSRSSGSIDLFQIFTERMLDCVAQNGAIGIIVPSSFHANEGTTHLRHRFLRETTIESCYSFENRRKQFDVHGRQKFTLLLARKGGATSSFRCGFYLDSIAQLSDPDRIMTYDREFIAATGAENETLLELRGQTDLRVAKHLFVGRSNLRTWLVKQGVTFGREAHMTDDSYRFTPIGVGGPGNAIPLHEGKTFYQYTDRWKVAPRYAVDRKAMQDKPNWLRASTHYRLAFREIARSTDERTMIAAVIPPGSIFGHKGTCEKTPWERPNATALILCAVLNSFTFDWCVRQKIAVSVSLFMLNACPFPTLSKGAARFLAHGALRLSCRHAGYSGLWREQSGRPDIHDFESADERAELRAAIDAVVARGYGLQRDDYRHILTSFSHNVQQSLAEKSVAAFDSLTTEGSSAFYRRHDPFTNVNLIGELSQPCSESPTASATFIPSTPADKMPPA